MTSLPDLAPYSLARQFPPVTGRDTAAVADVLAQVGPIQSQTARSTFLGLAARMPGVTHATITAAFESLAIVRGSTLRGTVHTCAAGQHPMLDLVTRIGMRRMWERTIRLRERTLDEVWAGIELFARDEWRTPDQLQEHLTTWLARHDPSAEHDLASRTGRYLAFGHGGLIRRPLTGPWSGQGAAGYRAAAPMLRARDMTAGTSMTQDEAVDALVMHHVRAHGPSSLHDMVWWSGLPNRVVMAALGRLREALAPRFSIDARTYWDLPDAQEPSRLAGVRLLPEFDAVLCGYDAKARDRFVDPAGYRVLWQPANGLLRAPVLHDQRLTGYWRLTGSGPTRQVEVIRFTGAPRLRRTDLDGAVSAVAAALDVTIGTVTLD